MGELISLAEHRIDRPGDGPARGAVDVAFHFDLSSPWTYLAAERVDRLLGGVRWCPSLGGPLLDRDGGRFEDCRRARRRVEERAVELAMPLIWPECWPASGRGAMRVATYAVEVGRAAPFALAASRLAFCGGYDLDDPEILAEAAAAAGIGLREAFDAAGDLDRDQLLEHATLELLELGATDLPAFVVGEHLYCGEATLSAAAAAASWQAPPQPPKPGWRASA